jgi:hypothetical protein
VVTLTDSKKRLPLDTDVDALEVDSDPVANIAGADQWLTCRQAAPHTVSASADSKGLMNIISI